VGSRGTADAQRKQIADVVQGLLGTPYDWGGIVADAMEAIHAPDLWAQNWHGQGAPGHVVCSSLACWAYEHVGLPRPTYHEARFTTPADWEQFIVTGGFNEP
jgi:cell wall-associated NlpC family hydrolase